MTHGDSNPLQALRYVRLMQALKTATVWFAIVFVVGMAVYGAAYITVGTSVAVWLAVTIMLFAGVVAANVSLYIYHKEVFGL